MSALTDAIPDNPPGDQLASGTAPDPGASETASDAPAEPGGAASRLMIAVAMLTAHSGNVRADLDLGEEFCASVAEVGVRMPLQVTYDETGGFRVI